MFNPIPDFKMIVYFFRKIDSPCIGNWTLQKVVKDNGDQISFSSSHTTFENFYMYDYLNVFPTTQKAKNTCIDVIKTLSAGRFKLTKFIFNSEKSKKTITVWRFSKILYCTQIYRSLQCKKHYEVYDGDDDEDDELLKVEILIEKDIPMAKRSLLSLVSSIFNPLGILNLAIMEPKQIIQLSWQRKIGWEDHLNLEIR